MYIYKFSMCVFNLCSIYRGIGFFDFQSGKNKLFHIVLQVIASNATLVFDEVKSIEKTC